jgi:hypothetical protein
MARGDPAAPRRTVFTCLTPSSVQTRATRAATVPASWHGNCTVVVNISSDTPSEKKKEPAMTLFRASILTTLLLCTQTAFAQTNTITQTTTPDGSSLVATGSNGAQLNVNTANGATNATYNDPSTGAAGNITSANGTTNATFADPSSGANGNLTIGPDGAVNGYVAGPNGGYFTSVSDGERTLQYGVFNGVTAVYGQDGENWLFAVTDGANFVALGQNDAGGFALAAL